MKSHKRIKYTDEPIGKIKIVPDFLPPPDKLIISLKQNVRCLRDKNKNLKK